MLTLRLLTTTAALLGAISAVAQSPPGEMARRAQIELLELRASGPPQLPAGLVVPQPPTKLAHDQSAKPITPRRYDRTVTPARLDALVAGAETLSTEEQAKPQEAAKPQAAENDDTRRLLAPVSQPTSPSDSARPKLLNISWSSLPVDATTTAAALTMVIGLFLLTTTLLKRAAPKSQRLLPGEVAMVLGRIPLSGKQTAHLLKVGSKLVLVSITPDEVKPLTEVTDPEEVTRLLGLCEQDGDHSASTAFRDVFDKLADEPAANGFLGDEAPLVDRQKLAAAYANTPGGRAGV